jgi:UDP-N-acetylmuramate--alanine ligase
LTLDLDAAIITSLELEHTDYFKDWQDYESAFLELIEKVKHNVYVLPNLNSPTILQHPKTLNVQMQTFDFHYLRGTYQQQNASLVYGLLNELTSGEKQTAIKKLIEQFRGLRRRMEQLTTTEKGAVMFSDYGHVASSLKGGLQALKEKFPDKKLVCIFQPHQMHRILQGRDAFPTALKGYDESYIYQIYAAREDFDSFAETLQNHLHTPEKITNIDELGALFAEHCGSSYLPNFDAVKKVIKQADENTVIVVYSAGDIDYLLRQYLQLL